MVQRRALGHLSREPLYNTRAVAQQTNVPPDTFRAWERRYGIPRPYRTSGNQRLYSERDIGVVAWLRDRTAEGMTISQAIQRLRVEHPEVFRDAPAQPASTPQPRGGVGTRLALLSERLVEALTDFDDVTAERVLDEALAQFTIEEACLSVIRPALIEIGDRWERGEIPAGLEHFATRLITRRLALIFNLVSSPSGRGTIVAVCAPGEEHEIGLLMLAIFLGRRSWRVIFLGSGLPIDDLITTLEHVEPDLVCIGATTAPAAASAYQAADQILRRVVPPPAIAYGGRAFTLPEVRAHPNARGAQYLDGTPDEMDDRVATLVEQRRALLRAYRHPRGEGA